MRLDPPATRPAALIQAVSSLRGAACAAVLLGAFANLAGLALPLYTMQVYDRVLMSRNITTLVMLTLIAVVVLAVYAALDGLRNALLVRCSIAIDRTLSGCLFDATVRGRMPSSGITGVSDVSAVRDFVSGGLVAYLDLPWVPLFVLLAFAIHPMLGVATLTGAALTIAVAFAADVLTRDAAGEAGRHRAEADRRLIGVLRDPGSISALGMRDAMRATWMRCHDAALMSHVSAGERTMHFLAVAKFVRMGVQIAVMAVAAHLVIERAIQPGVIFAATLFIGRALAPIEHAIGSWRRLVAARHAYARMKTLLASAPRDGERLDLPDPAGRIVTEGLCVTAPGAGAPLLKDVNFSVEPGEMLLVVGPSGAGKSTLLRALVGILPAASGTIRLDGAALSQRDPERLGLHIGYVAQDIVLFEGTIAENIARHRAADTVSVIAAAQAAEAHETILRLPLGYDTQVGPSGEWLSGGMRQRIALARALHGDPCLVVLDEPNSHIDPAGDQALVQILRRLKAAGRTLIVVSHKTGLMPVADKILVMANGTAQAFGARDEVLQKWMRPRVVAAGPSSRATASDNIAAYGSGIIPGHGNAAPAKTGT